MTFYTYGFHEARPYSTDATLSCVYLSTKDHRTDRSSLLGLNVRYDEMFGNSSHCQSFGNKREHQKTLLIFREMMSNGEKA